MEIEKSKDPNSITTTPKSGITPISKYQSYSKTLTTSQCFILCFLISLFDMGSSYVVDMPQCLSEALCKKRKICKGETYYFYSAYALPNIFFNIFGGYLIHRFGHKRCLVAYSSCVLLGVTLFYIGAIHLKNFNLMIIARVIEGIGAESLMITQYFCTILWFKNMRVSFALGINQSFSYLGVIMGYYLYPKIYEMTGTLRNPLEFGIIFPLISFSAIQGYILYSDYLEKNAEKIWLENPEIEEENKSLVEQEEENNSSRNSYRSEKNEEVEEEKQKSIGNLTFKDFKKFSGAYWIICAIMATIMPAAYLFSSRIDKTIKENFHISFR